MKEATVEYKGVQKFATEAMKRDQVVEAWTGNNYYSAGGDFERSDDENEPERKKKKPKFFKWCDNIANNKIWTSKYFFSYNQHVSYIVNKKSICILIFLDKYFY